MPPKLVFAFGLTPFELWRVRLWLRLRRPVRAQRIIFAAIDRNAGRAK